MIQGRSTITAVAVLVAALGLAGLSPKAAAQTTDYPLFVACSVPVDQVCDTKFVQPVVTAGTLKAEYIITGHCSSIRVRFFVDSGLVFTSEFLGWVGAPAPFDLLPLDTGEVNLGPVSPGAHTIEVEAEGQFGGCNIGDLASWAGTLRVTTSPVIDASIDIKPGDDPNSINLCSGGAVPVAILGSETFDVFDIDTETLRFAEMLVKVVGKKDPHTLCSYEDVDGDFLIDLVCHYLTTDIAALDGESTSATVKGELLDGTPFEGTDSVNIVKDTCW